MNWIVKRFIVHKMVDKIQDLNLPNTVVTRLIKEALPDGINIGKEARAAISRAAAIFSKSKSLKNILKQTSLLNGLIRVQ